MYSLGLFLLKPASMGRMRAVVFSAAATAEPALQERYAMPTGSALIPPPARRVAWERRAVLTVAVVRAVDARMATAAPTTFSARSTLSANPIAPVSNAAGMVVGGIVVFVVRRTPAVIPSSACPNTRASQSAMERSAVLTAVGAIAVCATKTWSVAITTSALRSMDAIRIATVSNAAGMDAAVRAEIVVQGRRVSLTVHAFQPVDVRPHVSGSSAAATVAAVHAAAANPGRCATTTGNASKQAVAHPIV
jgi:hypothetical protein